VLRLLIEKEARDLIGSVKFAITFGVCALLIIAAFYASGVRHKLNMAQYNASMAEQSRSLEGVTDWFDVHDVRIFLPPQPLASLVSGVDNDISRTATITGRGDIPTDDSRYNEDPIYAIFRFLDLKFIFTVILSLFAILLGYDAICGEKENGTLKLALSNAVPRNTYLLGKLLGSFVSLTVSIIVAALIGILLLIVQGINLSGEEWLRLFMILAAGLLFFGVFLSMSIFISALTHRSSNSFLILLVIWILTIQVIPRASVLLAARSVNVPSVDEIDYKKSTLAIQLSDEFHESLMSVEIPAKADPDYDPMLAFSNYMDSLSNIRETKMNELSARLSEERHNKQKHQESIAFTLARISPATQFTLAATHLAGTSLSLKNRFYDESHEYQDAYGAFIKDKTGMNPGGMLRIKTEITEEGDGAEAEQKPEQIDINEMPEFAFSNYDFKKSLESAVVDIGLLSILNLIFFAGAFIAFTRYDVR